MRKAFVSSAATVLIICLQQATAQNTSPYWSQAGNSNASTSSKLGTTTSVPLRLITNNSTRIYISPSAGYMGIGTTSPSARLHVNSASGTSPLKIQINGTTKLYMSSAGGLSVGASTAAPSNGLYVAGNVGIGTATPSYKLQVVGNVRFTTGLTIDNDGLTATNKTGNGVVGYGNSAAAAGIYGIGYYGVYGSGSDYGFYGEGSRYGAFASSGFTGVYGTGGSYGMYGNSTGSNGMGVAGSSNYIGVYGEGNYYGVMGNSENIGVFGSSPTYAGYFNGNVYTSGSYLPSSRKLKENITVISSALAILSKLQPKEYEYKQDGVYKSMHLPQGKRFGLIAEEVEEVLPGLVKATEFDPAMAEYPDTVKGRSAPHPAEKIEFKALNYTELIPIMIKGMQEQQAENKALKEEVNQLRQMVLELKGSTGTVTASAAYLEQNTPNPIRASTTIRYHIPETVTSARLDLTNAKGQLVRTMTLTSSSSQVSLNTSMMASGTYNYTLYVDGKQVDSKRLVIAR